MWPTKEENVNVFNEFLRNGDFGSLHLFLFILALYMNHINYVLCNDNLYISTLPSLYL